MLIGPRVVVPIEPRAEMVPEPPQYRLVEDVKLDLHHGNKRIGVGRRSRTHLHAGHVAEVQWSVSGRLKLVVLLRDLVCVEEHGRLTSRSAHIRRCSGSRERNDPLIRLGGW